MWTHRHLLGIDQLSLEDATAVLNDAAEKGFLLSREAVKKSATLRGKTIVNLFFESSTRTRASFELAGKRLGADVLNISAAASSMSKGETLLDTVRNIEAMRADVIVMRHPAAGAAQFVAARTGLSIVNAGDGAHEHPTQALLDAFTIRHHKKRIQGLVIAICGDILHSRVARSNALLLTKLGARVRLCGPRTMMPVRPEVLGGDGHGQPGGGSVEIAHRMEDAVASADVIMMLRIQSERLGGAMMATTREYSRTFGLNPAMLARAKPDAIVMHPGPINRGVELDPAIADGARSVILDQVEAGVAVRMSILELVCQASLPEAA